MKRRRNRDASQGSLDLLLDTITNAFGGIVLLSLLVVLLVNESGPARTRPSESAQADRSQELEEALHRRDQLRRARQAQEAFDSRFSSPEIATLAETIQNAQREKQDMLDEIERLQAEVREAAEVESRLKERKSDLERAIEQAKGDSEKLENKLDQERGMRRVTLDLPKESPTFKMPVVFVLRYDELFQLDRSLGNGPFELNKSHFQQTALDPEISLDSAGVSVSSRRGNGIPLTSDTPLRRVLGGINTSTSYATFCVWSDSFVHFGRIRAVCIKLGLQYRIIPVMRGPIVEQEGRASAQ